MLSGWRHWRRTLTESLISGAAFTGSFLIASIQLLSSALDLPAQTGQRLEVEIVINHHQEVDVFRILFVRGRDAERGYAGRVTALNCGTRHYLHDDLETVTLSQETVSAAMELWPSLERRVGLPDDLERILKQLEA